MVRGGGGDDDDHGSYLSLTAFGDMYSYFVEEFEDRKSSRLFDHSFMGQTDLGMRK